MENRNEVAEADVLLASVEWPTHLSLSISHNEHKTSYQSLADYLDFLDVDQDERAECLASGELWEIRWYPTTPVGSFHVVAGSLASAIRRMRAVRST